MPTALHATPVVRRRGLRWQLAAGTVFGLALVGLAVRGVEPHELGRAMRDADLRWLPAILALMLASGVTRAVRCRLLLAERSIGLGELFSNVMVGVMANDVLPLRLGELVRVYLFRRRNRVAPERAVAVIAVERCLDLVMLAGLFALASFLVALPPGIARAGRSIGAAAGLFAAGLYAVLLAGPACAGGAERLLPAPLGGRVASALERFHSGLGALGSAGRVAGATAASALTWAAYAGVSILYLALGGLPAQASVGLALMVATGVATAIPGPPGFIGTYHLACRLMLEAAGYPASRALAVAIVSHAVQYLGYVGIGLACYGLELRGGSGRAAFGAALGVTGDA